MNSTESKTNYWKLLNLDSSLILLIISNIITIFFAIKENWSVLTIMWIYWTQSVIIGFFTFIKILKMKKFTTDNFRINGKQPEPTENTKYKTALFFMMHYGFFHLCYLIFLVPNIILFNFSLMFNNFLKNPEMIGIIITLIIFFLNHLYSFIINYKTDSEKVRNIGTMMTFPYARILPMHLTIVCGSFISKGPGTLLFFLILKTIADVIMHQVEHHL